MMTMVMNPKTITATKLKAQLLGALDEVQNTGRPYVVTKHGKPVAKIVPIIDDRPLLGSVKMLVSEDELLAPFDVEWNALRD
jgi:prevent-host-death family protein